MNQTMHDGAEATITQEDGTVVKERQPKPYRHPELDERLRTDRTQDEARLLKKAYQAGVRVPTVEDVEGTTLRMTCIDGPLLKNVLEDRLDICDLIGDSIARLHNKDIVHGDLTTSNMILYDGEVYFIDFGLGTFSQRIEDYAIDLHLFRQVLESTHTVVADEAMDRVLTAYQEQCEDADAVMDRYEEIAERGRYK